MNIYAVNIGNYMGVNAVKEEIYYEYMKGKSIYNFFPRRFPSHISDRETQNKWIYIYIYIFYTGLCREHKIHFECNFLSVP